jgi:hypothetical protein
MATEDERSARPPSIESRDPRARIGFGIANVAVALFVVFGVFRLLPTRWWVVDGGAVIIASLLGASGVALLRKHRLAEQLTRVAATVGLALGLATFLALVTTASWLSGVYGQVGLSGAIVFGLVAALVLPYVVVLPAVELAWVGPRWRAAAAKAAPSEDARSEADADDDALRQSEAPASGSKRRRRSKRKGRG